MTFHIFHKSIVKIFLNNRFTIVLKVPVNITNFKMKNTTDINYFTTFLKTDVVVNFLSVFI